MFNISIYEWQLIGSLTVERACGSMVCLKGKLYVLGGMEVGADAGVLNAVTLQRTSGSRAQPYQ